MNGAIGIVTDVGKRPGELTVRFETTIVEYDPEHGTRRTSRWPMR
jgi:hypothetical protein